MFRPEKDRIYSAKVKEHGGSCPLKDWEIAFMGSAMNHRHSSESDSPIRGHGGKQPSNPLR